MPEVSRRIFVRAAAAIGAGLSMGVFFASRAGAPGEAVRQIADWHPLEWEPYAFVRVGSDDLVTVFCKHTEMGQGIHTGMATLVAEELDATWEQMRVEGAPADAAVYSNLLWSEQMTGGSTSLVNSFEQLRQSAAAVRQLLVAAAAQTWNVPAMEIIVRDGEVIHVRSDRRLTFGELADTAAQQPLPESVSLKTRSQFRLIGDDLPRPDLAAKTDGSAIYTQDFSLPGLLTAVVAHPPRFGSTLRSFNGDAAKELNGVADVVQIPGGVAVVGDSFWTVNRARELLRLEWDESAACTLSSDEIMAQFKRLAGTPGVVARETGSVTAAFDAAHRVVEAEFEFPYLAHAALEPMNCIVRLTDEGCEIWNAAQQQTRDQADAAAILGIAPAQVKVNMLYAGGSFGRRASKDYTVEAVHIVKAIGGRAPVKLVWSRADDMLAGHYRPMNYHRLWGALDAHGNPIVWQHRLIGQSIATQHSPDWIIDGVDGMSVEGAHDWLYAIPNLRVDLHSPEVPVPVLWYRGTAGTHAVFSVEVFMDELAAAAGQDPVVFRQRLLQDEGRMRHVLEVAATKAGWGSALGAGRGRGIAMCKQRDSYMAQVAEVSVGGGGYTVDRVITALDCGLIVNPDVVRAQVEGGTGFGLSSTIGDEITLKDGYVQQTNFDTYPLLRIDQMPEVETHLIDSSEPVSGVGDLTPMLIGAAVSNALYAVTGTRYRKLPIRLSA